MLDEKVGASTKTVRLLIKVCLLNKKLQSLSLLFSLLIYEEDPNSHSNLYMMKFLF